MNDVHEAVISMVVRAIPTLHRGTGVGCAEQEEGPVDHDGFVASAACVDILTVHATATLTQKNKHLRYVQRKHIDHS